MKPPDEMTKEELDAYIEALEAMTLRIVEAHDNDSLDRPYNYLIEIRTGPDADWSPLYVFGLPQGGVDKAEALFWAERAASRNGFQFTRPPGWEDIEAALPERDD